MRLLVSGPPSCGKSTQGRLLAADLGIPHVSSGALIRDAAASGDAEAKRMLDFVADGSLAPSGYISALVASRLTAADCQDGFVLDGYPRRLEEAMSLVSSGVRIDAMIALAAPDEVLTARVVRRAGEGRRDDDPAAFPRRLRVWRGETLPVRGLLERMGVPVMEIDASGASLTTHVQVLSALRVQGLAERPIDALVPA